MNGMVGHIHGPTRGHKVKIVFANNFVRNCHG